MEPTGPRPGSGFDRRHWTTIVFVLLVSLGYKWSLTRRQPINDGLSPRLWRF